MDVFSSFGTQAPAWWEARQWLAGIRGFAASISDKPGGFGGILKPFLLKPNEGRRGSPSVKSREAEMLDVGN